MKRVLIIGAKNSADIAYAANLVRTYEVDRRRYEKQTGRRNSILYWAEGAPPAEVWFTNTQITVCFSDQGAE